MCEANVYLLVEGKESSLWKVRISSNLIMGSVFFRVSLVNSGG